MMRARNIALCVLVVMLLGCASSRFQPAKVASERKLDYPLVAQLEKIEGDVVVGVFVDEEGTPEDVRILESSGYAVLDTAAYDFVTTLSFQPALVDEKPISSWTKLVLKYKLSEVAFEGKKWHEDVRYFHSSIEKTTDPQARLDLQRKLFVRLRGLVNYVERYPIVDINYTIKGVLTPETRDRWRKIMQIIPAPFTVFDDFLQRYPNSPLQDVVREELIRLLIDAEGDIRVKALKSSKIARNSPQLIEMIETRLDELQRAEYEKLNL